MRMKCRKDLNRAEAKYCRKECGLTNSRKGEKILFLLSRLEREPTNDEITFTVRLWCRVAGSFHVFSPAKSELG